LWTTIFFEEDAAAAAAAKNRVKVISKTRWNLARLEVT